MKRRLDSRRAKSFSWFSRAAEVLEERVCLSTIYWTDGTDFVPSRVQRFEVGGSGSIETVLTNPMPTDAGYPYFSAVAVDEANGHIYAADGQFVFRTTLDGQNRVNLIELPFDRIAFYGVTDLAIDLQNQKIYYLNAGLRLFSANLGGGTGQLLANFSHGGPVWSFGLDIDPQEQRVYFGDSISTGNYLLQSASQSGVSLFLDFGTTLHASGVEIDPVARKIYWSDQNVTDAIYSANLDGSGMTTVLSGVNITSAGLALDVVNQQIYFPDGQQIYRVNTDGSGLEPVVATGTNVLYLEVSPSPETEPDLVANSLSIDGGVVSYSYRIDDAALPNHTTVGLYWSADDIFNAADDLAFHYPITGDDLRVGDYSATITVADLLTSWAHNNAGDDRPPTGTTHLLLVVDPSSTNNPEGLIQESDETNNQIASRFPLDIEATFFSSNGHTESPSTLFVYSYNIRGVDLPNNTTMAFYWSANPTFGDSDSLAFEFPISGDDLRLGSYLGGISRFTLNESWKHFNGGDKQPPQGTAYLLFVVDPANTINEENETNNVRAIRLDERGGPPGFNDAEENPLPATVRRRIMILNHIGNVFINRILPQGRIFNFFRPSPRLLTAASLNDSEQTTDDNGQPNQLVTTLDSVFANPILLDNLTNLI